MIEDKTILGYFENGMPLEFSQFLKNPYELRNIRRETLTLNAVPLLRVCRSFDPMFDASPEMLKEVRPCH